MLLNFSVGRLPICLSVVSNVVSVEYLSSEKAVSPLCHITEVHGHGLQTSVLGVSVCTSLSIVSVHRTAVKIDI